MKTLLVNIGFENGKGIKKEVRGTDLLEVTKRVVAEYQNVISIRIIK